MTENPLLERATRFVSALCHCQALGVAVHAASEEGACATCQMWRQDRPVANVAITTWQSTPAEPIAIARAHFKIDELARP